MHVCIRNLDIVSSYICPLNICIQPAAKQLHYFNVPYTAADIRRAKLPLYHRAQSQFLIRPNTKTSMGAPCARKYLASRITVEVEPQILPCPFLS